MRPQIIGKYRQEGVNTLNLLQCYMELVINNMYTVLSLI